MVGNLDCVGCGSCFPSGPGIFEKKKKKKRREKKEEEKESILLNLLEGVVHL